MLLPTFYQEIQRRIDKIGYTGHDDITQAPLTPDDDYHAPVPVHGESDWYQNFMFVGEDRLQRYADFVDMDTHPLTSSALDIYAEESTQRDAWGNVIQVISGDQTIKDELNHLLFQRLNINHSLFRTVRETCKYGDKFQYVVLQKDKKGILFLKDMPVSSVWRLEWNGKLLAFVQQTPQGITPPLDPFSVVHWRIALNQEKYKPYGTSIFDPCRRHYRQLKLMEDAMVVYRITRAPERRVFFINCGRLPPAKAESYMKKIIHRFRKRSIINPATGEIDWRSNPLAPDEDFYVPVRDGQDGTRIDQLSGAANLGETDDVVWFKDQILAYLKIPRIYLQDADGGPAERRENLAMQDIRFARTIERVQSQVLEGLTKIAIIHLLLRGYDKRRAINFVLQATTPSYAHERAEQEVEQGRLSLADQYFGAGYPREYTWERVMKLTKKETRKLMRQRRKEDLILAEREAQVDAYRNKATEYYEELYADKWGLVQAGDDDDQQGQDQDKTKSDTKPSEPPKQPGEPFGSNPDVAEPPGPPDVFSKTTTKQSTTRQKETESDEPGPDVLSDPAGEKLVQSPRSRMAYVRKHKKTRTPEQLEEGFKAFRLGILGEDGESYRRQVIGNGDNGDNFLQNGNESILEDTPRRARGPRSSCHVTLMAEGELLPLTVLGGISAITANGNGKPLQRSMQAFKQLQSVQRNEWVTGLDSTEVNDAGD